MPETEQGVLIYGEGFGGGLVFIDPDRADEIAGVFQAMQEAKTWGEFRLNFPKAWDMYVLDIVVTALEVYDDADLFVLDDVEALRTELKKYDMGRLCPSDDEKFERPGVCSDGDWPPFPDREMAEWMDDDVIEHYGEWHDTTLNGPYLNFPLKHKEAVLTALKELGYHCVLDQARLEKAYGQ